jgi:phosphoribosylformylglycinamidine (FGAM) synthase PurS component
LKLLASNLVIAPIMTGLYLVALGKIAGLSIQRATAVAKGRLLSTMKISLLINPLVQAYAFKVSVIN